MRYILLAIFLFSCTSHAMKVQHEEVFDSTLVRPLHDSVAKILPVVERVIVKKQQQIIYKIKEAEKAIEVLKLQNSELSKVTKTVIVRDTIYIKEKTNFWGKKKISTDSSSSVDSTIQQ